MATTYRVRRGLAEIDGARGLKLGGRLLPRGTVFDVGEFPEFLPSDFRRWEEHRLIEALDSESDDRIRAERRHTQIMERARKAEGALGPTEPVVPAAVPVEPVVAVGHECECGFVAKNEHGLRVHRGRTHKE